MGKINVLDFEVANLIAAGEVVDRPSSCVKELLENAIDAGSTSVTVEIKHGGVSFIRIADNGCGIEKEDLPVAILRHATSKIKTAADLNGIATLGFRGEALAAISSVSKVRILTKTASAEFGAMLEANGGEIINLCETGCSNGTTVIAEDLFYNVPARRKFLKKDSTEAASCSAVVEKIALSHPEIAVKFISDGEVKFITSGNGRLQETIYAIYGRDIATRSLKIDRTEGGIRITGYISEPDLIRSNRNMENFFINGRYVKSRTASAAVEQAYSSKSQSDKFPFCVINIEIPPAVVDVNVHPAKLEVKFTNEKLIFDAVYYAVQTALEADAIRPELKLGSQLGGESDSGKPDKQNNDTEKNPYRVDSYKGQAGFHMPTADSVVFDRTGNAKTDKTPSNKNVQSLINAFVPQDQPAKKTEQLRIPNNTIFQNIKTPEKSAETLTEADSTQTGTRLIDKSADSHNSGELDEAELLRSHKIAAENLKAMSEYTPSYIFASDPDEHSHPEAGLTLTAEDESKDKLVQTQSGETSDDTTVESCSSDKFTEASEANNSEEATEQKTDNNTQKNADKYKIPDKTDTPEYIILGEAYNCYIIVQLEDRLLMIDKHAAHERIIFDELCRKMHAATKSGQIMLVPYEIPLLCSEAEAIDEYAEKIRGMGFDFTKKSGGVSQVIFSLTQIPDELNINEASALFADLAEKLSSVTATVESASAEFFESRLWQAACKAAMKGGRKYDSVHLKWICDRLLTKSENGVIRTCPHGRPVAFEIKKSSIERQFARIQ